MTDVYESQARYDIAVSDELNAEKLLEDAREALFALTGENIQRVDGLQEEIVLLSPEPTDPGRWVDMAMDRSPLFSA